MALAPKIPLLRRFFFALALAGAGFCGGAPAVRGADAPATGADVARAIRETIRDLEQTRKQAVEARADFEAKEADLARRAESLAGEREKSGGEQDALAQERGRLEARLEQIRAGSRADEEALARLAGGAAPLARKRAAAVRAGIPFRRASRASEFDAIAKLLADRGKAARKEGLTRFFSAMDQELRLARTEETLDEEVSLGGGRKKHAYVLRLGLVNEIFLTEDGETAGVSDPSAPDGWRVVSGDRKDHIRAAIEEVQRRQAPGIEPLPFLLQEKPH